MTEFYTDYKELFRRTAGRGDAFLNGLRDLLKRAEEAGDQLWTLKLEARILQEKKQYQESLAALDTLIKSCESAEHEDRDFLLANGLNSRAICHFYLKEYDQCFLVIESLLERFGDSNELGLQEQVAMALYNKGVTLKKLNKPEEAIKAYNSLLERFRESNELVLQEKVASALCNKGITLRQLDKPEEAIEAIDAMIERFGDSTELVLQKQVATALCYKGIALGKLDKPEEEIKVYDALLERFGDHDDPEIKDYVNLARSLKENAEFTLNTKSRPLIDRLKTLMQDFLTEEKKNEFTSAVKAYEKAFDQMLARNGRFNPEGSYLFTLRQWNSYTPIIPRMGEPARGGGYFIWHRGFGIVVDPGYDFIRNFYEAGGVIGDIDAVVVTHAHDDHTAEIESLITLLFKYNSKATEKKQVDFYLNESSSRKLAPLLPLRNQKHIGKVCTLPLPDPACPQKYKLSAGIHLQPLPAFHDDVISKQYAIGLLFELTMSEEPNGVRRILFTGDTSYFPTKQVESKGKKEDIADVDEEKAIYRKYPRKLWSGTEGGDCIDFLIPHLGSVKPQELIDDLKQKADEMTPGNLWFYPNHLGIRGLALLLDNLNFKTALVSEFGEELKEIKVNVIELLQDAFAGGETKKDCTILPADTSMIADINTGKMLCHETLKMEDPKNMHMVAHTINNEEHIYLVQSDCPHIPQIEGALAEYLLECDKIKMHDNQTNLPHIR